MTWLSGAFNGSEDRSSGDELGLASDRSRADHPSCI
jgi:hypothetical protein